MAAPVILTTNDSVGSGLVVPEERSGSEGNPKPSERTRQSALLKGAVRWRTMMLTKTSSRQENHRAAVFLDRDGTIIEDRGDLWDPAQVVFFRDTVPALRRLADLRQHQ